MDLPSLSDLVKWLENQQAVRQERRGAGRSRALYKNFSQFKRANVLQFKPFLIGERSLEN